MDKYINAEEYQNYLAITKLNHPKSIKLDFNDGLMYAIEAVKSFPSADVVEVVRCKDCKYREDYIIFGKPTAYYCLRGCVDSNLSLNENEYCCWGERKETNE